ncbi:glycosyl transferase [Actinophytocola xinjiangensis]|uniref:Glycosyl transferase n=1 Tax=Actinophytocola xinjiangensis TaxID=485602 RepID=A0A7Z1AX43_9PSEU|nr:glycosyltransferase [Actinophytocola xinjiangensis]OLF09715.1 glycosyl transferase [Actinophytocola xinjiangensis]
MTGTRRFLVVVPPLVGHVNPLVGVAAELARRGHDVAWAGHPGLVHRLAGDDQRVFDCAVPEGPGRTPDLTGPAAFRFLWAEFLLPLAEAMAPGVAAAIEAFAPDVVVCDQHAVAGALVAQRYGVVHVTSASTSAEIVDPLAAFPKIGRWLTDRLAALRAAIGDPAATSDPRFSPHGVLAFTATALVGDVPAGVRVLGPAIAPRRTAPDFPWEALDQRRATVLVSLGTANADAATRFLTEAAGALALLTDRVQGVVVDPGHVLDRTPLPEGTVVREYVPQLDLLSQVDAVVSHGGHNTVCEALWHGVPLVLAPIRDDQPIVAEQVVAAGAGVRVRFGRVDAVRLAAAVDTVLDPATGHHACAAAIGRVLRAGDGVLTAADHLTSVPLAPGVPDTPENNRIPCCDTESLP